MLLGPRCLRPSATTSFCRGQQMPDKHRYHPVGDNLLTHQSHRPNPPACRGRFRSDWPNDDTDNGGG